LTVGQNDNGSICPYLFQFIIHVPLNDIELRYRPCLYTRPLGYVRRMASSSRTVVAAAL
jgi:hypothetical protein